MKIRTGAACRITFPPCVPAVFARARGKPSAGNPWRAPRPERRYETLRRLHQEGLTLLLAEQAVALALDVADYAYVLQTGRTVLEGSSRDLRDNPHIQRIYLGAVEDAGPSDSEPIPPAPG